MYQKSKGLRVHSGALELSVASQRRRVASCLRPHRVQKVDRWELSSYLRVAWGQWLHYIGVFYPLPSVPTLWSTLERSIQRRTHSKHCDLFTNLTLLRRWYKFSVESISFVLQWCQRPSIQFWRRTRQGTTVRHTNRRSKYVANYQ